jgi:hypothetical protein
MKIIGARKVSDIDVLVIDTINSMFNRLNEDLLTLKIKIMPIDLHMIDRIHDRNFIPEHVISGLSIFNRTRLCEFLYCLTKCNKDFLKFCLIFKSRFVIHGTVTRKSVYLIRFKTIVKHYPGYENDNLDDIQIIFD